LTTLVGSLPAHPPLKAEGCGTPFSVVRAEVWEILTFFGGRDEVWGVFKT
jgi:hypothetical protein